METKNKHAVALGRLGGKGGKGSVKRREAAIKANQIRWTKYAKQIQRSPITVPASDTI